MAKRRSFGYIRKVGNTYYASYIGLDNIRCNAPYSFTKKITAEMWLEDEKNLLDSGYWVSPEVRGSQKKAKNIYFNNFAEEFINNLELRPNSWRMYQNWYKKYIKSYFEKYRLCEITAQIVNKWYDDYLPKDRPSARYNAYILLKHIFTKAGEPDEKGNSLIEKNPCSSKNKTYKSKHTMTVLAKEQIEALYNAMPEKSKLSIYIAGILGLRIGEVCGLVRKNFNLVQKKLCIRHQVCRDKNSKIVLAPLKTVNSRRDIPIPDSLIPLIEHHLEKWVGQNDNDLVFTNWRGEIQEGACFNTIFKKAKQKAGLSHIRFHILRHTAATNIAAVSDLVTTMSILGHNSTDIAMRYQHAVDDRRINAMNKVGAEITKRKETKSLANLNKQDTEKLRQQLLKQLIELG
ncbi:MAG: site-specific integrase [Bifidobacteriaceae bacterium]|jgi:integrase|nr:site-specific integrase [Bifidobacteriaceae bacterium]